MALLSRTPLRVSFFGGGTDYPEYYQRKKGSVLGMAIDKYIYVAALEMSGIQDYRYRISYSRLELANAISEIQHPVIRAALKDYAYQRSLDVSILSDIPANSGLGSSSSFTVGFISLLKGLQNKRATKLDIALEAIRVERILLGENVGIQDQLHASFGGLNKFEFEGESITVTPLAMQAESLDCLNESLFLVYTGIRRHASDVASAQVSMTASGKLDSSLDNLQSLVMEGERVLRRSSGNNMVKDFAELLMESWKIKKTLSGRVTSNKIDEICTQCIQQGAIGVKLCGAGGGGFVLCIVDEHSQRGFIEKMHPYKSIKIGIDTEGTVILNK